MDRFCRVEGAFTNDLTGMIFQSRLLPDANGITQMYPLSLQCSQLFVHVVCIQSKMLRTYFELKHPELRSIKTCQLSIKHNFEWHMLSSGTFAAFRHSLQPLAISAKYMVYMCNAYGQGFLMDERLYYRAMRGLALVPLHAPCPHQSIGHIVPSHSMLYEQPVKKKLSITHMLKRRCCIKLVSICWLLNLL